MRAEMQRKVVSTEWRDLPTACSLMGCARVASHWLPVCRCLAVDSSVFSALAVAQLTVPWDVQVKADEAQEANVSWTTGWGGRLNATLPATSRSGRAISRQGPIRASMLRPGYDAPRPNPNAAFGA
jgi:hypothetical protein